MFVNSDFTHKLFLTANNYCMKTVLITGAAGGIGRATARRFAKRGFFVYAMDIDEERLAELQNELGANCLTVVCDVNKEESVRDALAEFDARFDVVVSNVGILVQNYFEKSTLKAYKQLINTNAFGTVNIAFQCLPLINRKGRLIFTSSAAAIFGLPKFAVYSGSKMFIRGFCEALGPELKNRKIKVADVMPFFVRTGLTDDMRDDNFKEASRQTPNQIAKVIYKASKSKKTHHYIGFKTKAIAFLARVTPTRFMQWFLRGYMNTK